MFALLVDANAHAMFGSDPAVHVGDGRFVLTFVLLPIGRQTAAYAPMGLPGPAALFVCLLGCLFVCLVVCRTGRPHAPAHGGGSCRASFTRPVRLCAHAAARVIEAVLPVERHRAARQRIRLAATVCAQDRCWLPHSLTTRAERFGALGLAVSVGDVLRRSGAVCPSLSGGVP